MLGQYYMIEAYLEPPEVNWQGRMHMKGLFPSKAQISLGGHLRVECPEMLGQTLLLGLQMVHDLIYAY